MAFTALEQKRIDEQNRLARKKKSQKPGVKLRKKAVVEKQSQSKKISVRRKRAKVEAQKPETSTGNKLDDFTETKLAKIKLKAKPLSGKTPREKLEEKNNKLGQILLRRQRLENEKKLGKKLKKIKIKR